MWARILWAVKLSPIYQHYKWLSLSGIFLGLINLIITIIVGVVATHPPIQPSYVVENKIYFHAFSIRSTPNVAVIISAIILFICVVIYFYFKYLIKNQASYLSYQQLLKMIGIIFLGGLIFSAISLGLAYGVFYYPYLITN